MSVQFILGRSGTGKTWLCIKEIIDELLMQGDKRLILLVPEQATYQAERALLSDKRISGYHRVNVLSFDRLIFLLLGKDTARPRLSKIGQQMIIHRILRANKDKLKSFGSSANRLGLGRQMAEVVRELNNHAKSVEDIETFLNKIKDNKQDKLTSLKLADIGLIFGEYLKFIEGKYVDPDVQLRAAKQKIGQADFIKGAKLWADGFSTFTGGELALLAELMRNADDTKIALCMDASGINVRKFSYKDIEPSGLFNSTQRTLAELLEIIKKCRLDIAEPVVLSKAIRFEDNKELGHIEKHLFEYEPPKIQSSGNVRIISAATRRSEVEFAAGEILKLVREKNYRFRDIAVVTSDIDSYEHYIRASFSDYGIEYFIDKPRSLSRHVLVEFVNSAVKIAAGGFLHSDIFASLKCGLMPMEESEIALLENYCLAFGVNDSDWEEDEPWKFDNNENPRFDEDKINKLRKGVVSPFNHLRAAILQDGKEKFITAGEFTKAVFDLLEKIEARKTIGKWIEEAERENGQTKVDEHRQFFARFVEVFDELVEVFQEEKMTSQEFLAIIYSAFMQLKLALVPPSLDEVLIGSIERSRHPDLKAVFLIGTTKLFPLPLTSGGILTADDRSIGEAYGFELGRSMSQALVERQYLTYIAFTRASKNLYVTYPSSDGDSAIPPSHFISDLEELFENISLEIFAEGERRIETIRSENELTELLCAKLGKDTTVDRDNTGLLNGLTEKLQTDGQLGAVGRSVSLAVNYENIANLSPDTAGGLWGQIVKGSATALSTFAACPYKYFAEYILTLEERKEAKLEPLDVGNFYHQVLDAVIKELLAEKADFKKITEKQMRSLVSEQISKLLSRSKYLSNFMRHSHHNIFIIDSAGEVLQDFAAAALKMIQAGVFRPVASEASFGNVKDYLGEYKLSLSKGRTLLLRGKIDRLDIAVCDGEKAALLIDYKRSNMDFDWMELFYGLNIQLPLYMLAVRNSKAASQICGGFLVPVEAGYKTANPQDEEEGSGFNHKAKGIFNGRFFELLDVNYTNGWNPYYNFYVSSKDAQYGNYNRGGVLKPEHFKEVLNFAERKIIEIGNAITSGKINITPYKINSEKACDFCDYKSLCRFDWQINNYNNLTATGKKEFLEKLEGCDE